MKDNKIVTQITNILKKHFADKLSDAVDVALLALEEDIFPITYALEENKDFT